MNKRVTGEKFILFVLDCHRVKVDLSSEISFITTYYYLSGIYRALTVVSHNSSFIHDSCVCSTLGSYYMAGVTQAILKCQIDLMNGISCQKMFHLSKLHICCCS